METDEDVDNEVEPFNNSWGRIEGLGSHIEETGFFDYGWLDHTFGYEEN